MTLALLGRNAVASFSAGMNGGDFGQVLAVSRVLYRQQYAVFDVFRATRHRRDEAGRAVLVRAVSYGRAAAVSRCARRAARGMISLWLHIFFCHGGKIAKGAKPGSGANRKRAEKSREIRTRKCLTIDNELFIINEQDGCNRMPSSKCSKISIGSSFILELLQSQRTCAAWIEINKV